MVVALAWAACRWIPRVPAALQAWVWWLVALKLALTFVPLPALPLPLLPAAESGATPAAAVAAPEDAGVRSALPDAVLHKPRRLQPAAATTWVDVLAIAWLLGIAVHGRDAGARGGSVRGLVRRATPLSRRGSGGGIADGGRARLDAHPAGLRVPRGRVPQVVGWRNPVVLRAGRRRGAFTSDEWRMALAHELMHVRRRDVLLGCLPALAERLYFFHPLARCGA